MITAKVYVNGEWEEKPIKVYDGAEWVIVTPTKWGNFVWGTSAGYVWGKEQGVKVYSDSEFK